MNNFFSSGRYNKRLLQACEYDKKRKELSFFTDTNIYLYISDDKIVKISADNNGYEVINESDFNDTKYVSYKVHPKLLYRIYIICSLCSLCSCSLFTFI